MLKDFFDLLWLSRLFSFDGAPLVKAIRATFKRRKTELPANVPLFLTDAFASDQVKQTQWQAFLRKNNISGLPGKLDTVIAELHDFLMPPLKAATIDEPFKTHWNANGFWR